MREFKPSLSTWRNRQAMLSEGAAPTLTSGRASTTLQLAQISVFSALIAVGTILSNILLGFALPPPLYEISLAPAFYLAIAVLFSRKVSFWSTALGSGVGEAVNILIFGQYPASIALSFVPGIILARAPEALIVGRFRQRAMNSLVAAMVLATIYETIVFFLIDWPIYSFTAFYAPFYCSQPPCNAAGVTQGFILAAFDFGTLIDLVWIPIALALTVGVRKAYRVKFFS